MAFGRMNRAPSMLFPYTRIKGILPYGTPPFYAIVQTDGSYSQRTETTRVAAILRPSYLDRRQKRVQTVPVADSLLEAQWHSVAFGLQLALDEGERNIALENDTYDIIQGLVTPGTVFRHEYARHSKDQILKMCRKADWVGARWIPKEHNRAGFLFMEFPLA